MCIYVIQLVDMGTPPSGEHNMWFYNCEIIMLGLNMIRKYKLNKANTSETLYKLNHGKYEY